MGTAARLLMAMPLHAVTAAYGEDGLRERLALEVADFAEDDRRVLGSALALAARLHAADRRQREPYLNHLLRVAIRVICYYDIRDAEVVCAALLHDAVEDHPGELASDGSQEAALAALAAEFGDRVAALVAAVTNPDFPPGTDRREAYLEHVTASLDACPWARVVKASDFTDNAVGILHAGPALGRLAAKYAPLVAPLRELIARADTPLGDTAKARILGQLDAAARRLTALLPPPGT